MNNKFEGDFPKLSKSNSLVLGEYIIYIKKIDTSYVAFEYKTRLRVVATDSKERLIEYLIKNKDKLDRLIKEYDEKISI